MRGVGPEGPLQHLRAHPQRAVNPRVVVGGGEGGVDVAGGEVGEDGGFVDAGGVDFLAQVHPEYGFAEGGWGRGVVGWEEEGEGTDVALGVAADCGGV